MLIVAWVVTFLLIVGIDMYAGTKVKTSEDWNGSDHSMGAFSVGCMLAAWQIGGMSIVGAAQNGYTMGIAGSWYSIAGSIYFLVMAVIAGPLRRHIKTASLPDFLLDRYGVGVARLQSYMWIVYGIVYIPIQLMTISSIIRIVFPSTSALAAMLLGVTIAAIYTGFAGMKGSASIARIVCIGTYILLAFFVGMNLKQMGGYQYLVAQLPEGYGSMSAMPTQQIMAWIVASILSYLVLQSALQPMLSAKSEKAARNGCLIGYALSAPICILTAIIGMMAKVQTDSLGDGSTAFAWAVRQMSHPLFAGILFAMITMIIAATLATMMMATGTIIANVYGTQINRNATDAKKLKISRIGTIVVAYVSLVFGQLIPSAQITNMFLTLTYAVTTPFSYSVIVGLFWKRVDNKASFYSAIVGALVAVVWIAVGLNSTLNLVYPTLISSYAVGLFFTLLNKENGKGEITRETNHIINN